jgi:superfamily II DNA or RNA helicase
LSSVSSWGNRFIISAIVQGPANPSEVYKSNGWTSWGDWLGSNRTSQMIVWLTFPEAKKIVRSLKLKNMKQYQESWRLGKIPKNIPSSPYNVYKNKGWISSGDWLGSDFICSRNREWLPFPEAKKIVHAQGFTSMKQYRRWNNRPQNIPTCPENTYKNKGWIGYTDWLGYETVQYLSFKDARNIVRKLGIFGQAQWRQYRKEGKIPKTIPVNPDREYKDKGWVDWGDWFGTKSISTHKRKYRPYPEASEYVHSLRLTSQSEFEDLCRTGKLPKDIPSNPARTYKDKGWVDMFDWLGYENTEWTIERIKKLLRALIEGRYIYDWDEAVLYSILSTRGVLNLGTLNRHRQLFANLIKASRTSEGRKAIEEYAYSDSENPPFLSDSGTKDDEEEIQTASSEELAQLVEGVEEEDDKIATAQQILAQTNHLESISVDEETMRFLLLYSVLRLWKSAFRDDKNKTDATIEEVRRQGKNGNRYHDEVADTFLSGYIGAKNILSNLPTGYAFPYNPTLMQLYVAYKIKTSQFFGNFSSVGTGKTLSAILASRVIESMMTLIVCPNDVVDQWKGRIIQTFPDCKVLTDRDEAFNAKYDSNKHQYLVLNYDKFSQDDSPNLILNLVKERIDFVVLDEIHFIKKRLEDNSDESQRRKNLAGLMTAARNENDKVKVLGMSATPVVNNLMEGRSLLELMSGKIYDDVATKATVPNAVTLFVKLTVNSIREIERYADIKTEFRYVEAVRPQNTSIKQLKANPLMMEQFLTDARIPEIIGNIRDQTIIYTEYVTEIIETISDAVRDAGYSFGLYTGSDRSGLLQFLNRKVQVLIASKPISVGLDGLQEICNRLIINTLPWTHAQYEQLLGRLRRLGQRNVVEVYIIKASVSGYPYDEQIKWNRIQFKRTLADCAIDGTLPEKNLVTPDQAAMELVNWLERLERGEISSVTRRDLDVKLTPIEIRHRLIKYGDLSKQHQRINSEYSVTTHKRMQENPEEWLEYHRQLDNQRKLWSVDPLVEIIARIKTMSPKLRVGDFGCGEAKLMVVCVMLIL